MAPRKFSKNSAFVAAIGVALGLVGSPAESTTAQDIPAVEADHNGARDLYLAVLINGRSTGRIASFRQVDDGSFTATAEALRDAGLLPPGGGYDADGFISLASLPDVLFEYNEARQTIAFTAPDAALDPQVKAVLSRHAINVSSGAAAWGTFANYSLVSAFGGADFERIEFEGLSGGVDAHFSTPFGVLDNSALLRIDPEFGLDAQRLDTTWTSYDVERMLTYHAGDAISGGLAWTRPIRFGGLQIQRDFSIRPDLITRPLPSFEGSAAVPTTIEVYTNNVRTFSGDFDPGPFVIEGIPLGTGANTATVVLRDFLGRETIVELPFYGSQRQLAEGVYDFSLEAGFPRLSLGTESFDYNDIPFGSLTLRYGLSDTVTVESHVEASEKHVNGGVGGAVALGSWGVATVALAGSEAGGLASAGLEVDIFGITAFARTQHTFGDYTDIASVSARQIAIGGDAVDFGPPKALDQFGLSFALPFDDPTRIALNYSRRRAADGERQQIANLSLSRALTDRAYLNLTASAVSADGREYSVFASITFQLGDEHRGTVGMDHRDDGLTTFAELSRPARRQAGNVGWLIGTTRGADDSIYGNATYHAPVARLRGTFNYGEEAVRFTTEADGAVVLAGGGVFLSNRIYDAFAVIDAGVSDVEVFHENRLIGRTGGGGRIVVPNIRAFQENRISIDPSNLPVDARVPSSREIVTALPRGGVVVDFAIQIETAAALVSFLDEFGAPVPVGSGGTLAGRDETFVIGYDGEAYLEQLDTRNRVTIVKPDRSVCTAEFEFDANEPAPVHINAVPCIPR